MLRLVLRSAHGTRSLRLAAAVAALIAVSFAVGLLAYGEQVVTGAAQATITAAAPEERALVLRGSAGVGGTDLATKDDALRAALARDDGGPPVDVFVAGYGLGQEFSGPVGTAAGDDHGRVFANVMFLDSLPAHATLLEGMWARPGQEITEATLPRAAAAVLDISVGDRVPVTDRRTEQTRDVLVTGIWEAVDPTDPYWLLAPGHDIGVRPGSHSYGPLVLDRADFLRSWADGASVAWVLRPDLTGAGLAELTRIREQFATYAGLLADVGLANGGQASTGIDALADRLGRADLVGRSALLTPVLLVTVLAGCALLLIALLLTEQRRGQTQLIRARGGSRTQLARLAGLEAAMLVLPAIVAAPPLSDAVLRWVGLESSSGAWRWVVAGGFGLACAAVLIAPSIRRSGTYVDELVARSRPRRLPAAQRAGVDLAVVALAALAWTQLRQYASPLSGSGEALGVDPLLASAPVLGVLAGTLLCLRLLPRVTDFAERAVDRRHWPAVVFALWQAGRRPHAGRVLLVALAVATSTLAWSLLGTAQRSIVDQADFAVGADLRLVETAAIAPEGRTAQVAALPGVAVAVPVSRMVLTVGAEHTRTTIIGIDATRAGEVMRSRDDFGLGPAVFADLAAPRPELPLLPLPPGATRLAATMAAALGLSEAAVLGPPESDGLSPLPPLDLTATAILLAPDGRLVRLPLGTVGTAQDARRFEVALPGDPGLALVQISVEVSGPTRSAPIHWSLTDVEVADASGAWSPLDLTRAGDWVLVDVLGEAAGSVDVRAASLQATREPDIIELFNELALSMDFAVMPVWTHDTVPVVATPPLLRTLGVEVGQVAPVPVAGTPVKMHVIGEAAAVPGTSRSPSAVLADLPSLAVAVARRPDHVVAVTEHWVATEPGATATTAQAAGEVSGVRVLDRVRAAEAAGRDPYGIGGRTALVVAGVGAFLLALIGIAVDVRASARRRVGEFAVLQTMGAGSRLLARTVLGEQGLLAGLGVLIGLGIGLGVAATLAPLVILTPSADRPEPPALLSVPWLPVLGTAGGLVAAAMILSGVVAATLGRRLAVARLRIGDEA